MVWSQFIILSDSKKKNFFVLGARPSLNYAKQKYYAALHWLAPEVISTESFEGEEVWCKGNDSSEARNNGAESKTGTNDRW